MKSPKLNGYIGIMTYCTPKKETVYEVDPSDKEQDAIDWCDRQRDDKWDLKKRDRYRFYVLNLSTKRTKEMPKWEDKYTKRWRRRMELEYGIL